MATNSPWGNNASLAADAPSYYIFDKIAANGQTLYANTTIGALINNVSVGVFAANNDQADAGKGYHAGWVTVTRYTGPIVTLTLSSNPGGYTNSNTFSVLVGGGTANANVTFTTNSTGFATGAVTILNGGSFANTDSGNLTFFVANTASQVKGANPTFTVTFGGRAGRISRETLVAMGSMQNTMTASAITYL